MISLIFSFLYLAPKALLIAAAVAPAAWLLVYVYKKDRLEKEPRGMLGRLVLWGVLSTILATVTESVGSALLTAILPGGAADERYAFWMYFVVVALSEEGFKYLVLHLRTWRAAEFNCQFDGVVYATFVSLGFALWENIGYVLMYGFGAALMRAITAIPGHASFGVFMGACYGLARRCENSGEHGRSVLWRILAVLLPAFIHGCYDYIATSETENITLTFVVFVAAVFITAFVLVKKLSDKDRYISNSGAGWYR